MKIWNVIALVGMMVLAGCGDGSSSSSTSLGMLGFKLGQEIDYTDKAAIKSLGITKVTKEDNGSISCEFKTNKPFRKFNTGSVIIDPKTKRVYIISSIIEGQGTEKSLEIANESDVTYEVMKEKFGGEWKRTREEYGTSFTDGKLGNGITASIIFRSSYGSSSCHIVLRNSDVVQEIKKRNLKKDVDSL